MSVSLSWRPVENGESLDTAAGSDLTELLQAAFGDLPVELNYNHVKMLQVMRKAHCGGTHDKALQQLINALDVHQYIVVEMDR